MSSICDPKNNPPAMMMCPQGIRIGKIKPFTGDTGKVLDWQVGFADPPRYYYGMNGAQERKFGFSLIDTSGAIYNALRKEYPAPSDCATAKTKLLKLQEGLKTYNDKLNAGEKTSIVIGTINALNKFISEYVDYVNNNCVKPMVSSPITNEGNLNSSFDPALSSATPSGSQAVSNNIQASVNNQPSISTPKTTAAIKSIPKWALYAGAGLLGLIIVIAVVKK